MEIITKKLSELTACPYNPRMITDEALAGLTASITEYGSVQPIIWNKRTGNVVGGNQRLKVLRAQGDAETEVVVVDLPLSKEKALNIALNSSHIAGDWTSGLGDLLTEIKLDLPDLYEELLLDDLLADVPEVELEPYVGETDPDEVPEPVAEPVIQQGDLVMLGRHRLLCGDSTVAEDVKRLMGGSKADVVFADPPYNLGYSGKGPGSAKSNRRLWSIFENDNLTNEAWLRFAKNFFKTWPIVTGDCYVCIDWRTYPLLLEAFSKGWTVWNCIVWKKNFIGLGYKYRYTHEFIVYASKGDPRLTKRDESDVWEIARDPTGEYEHPTQKPVEISLRAIRNSNGQIVFDPFLGSGTTMIACEQLRRTCFGVEIEPRYVQVATERYINFTGRPDDVTVERDGKQYKWGGAKKCLSA